MRITIAGSSGLIGTALVRRLRAGGHDVVRLVRPGSSAHPGDTDRVTWDPSRGDLPADAIDRADAVINLAGAGIGDRRWTDAYRNELVDSRLRTTDLLARAIAASASAPQVFLSGSAIGWYGDRGDEPLDETSSPGTGFLADLCRRWEEAAAPAAAAGTRVALLRTGIVLSAAGGALKKQLPLFKLGLGGRFGSGRQWQSWITIDDEVAAIDHLLTADVHGPVNLTAPEPVTNATFTATLGKVLHRPAVLPIPSFAPKLVLGAELVDTVLLGGQRVLPARLQSSGFAFGQPQLEGALRAVLGR
ncbi:MAG: TIGR01777 family protein [Actinobacteria bacterium]|nr:TIGR01777 family protein [Actinomycetota bacterium]